MILVGLRGEFRKYEGCHTREMESCELAWLVTKPCRREVATAVLRELSERRRRSWVAESRRSKRKRRLFALQNTWASVEMAQAQPGILPNSERVN